MLIETRSGFSSRSAVAKVGPDVVAGQFLGQAAAERLTSPTISKPGLPVIGERMAPPHIAEAGDEDAQGLTVAHFTAPEVMPRISWREKMR